MIALNHNACTGCGTRVNVCPHRVLALNNKKARMAYEESCIECDACQVNCRSDTIEVTKGTGCHFTIIKEDILKLAPHACGCG